MIPTRPQSQFWGGMSLRESLTACVTATFIVLSAMFFRIPLHLPGHRVLPLAFFLLLGRSLIKSGWAGTAIGLLGGLSMLAMGRENPSHVGQYLVAGMIADLAWLIPSRFQSIFTGALAGAAIGASWLPVPLLVNRLLGMESSAAIWTVMVKNGWAIGFGAIAGALAWTVAKRLRASGFYCENRGSRLAG
jgi:hypothetical protein